MPHFLTIHIPGPIQPFERDDRFADPLDKALRASGRLGKCVGGGTAMETEPEVRITGCDVEVEVKDLARAVPVVRDSLEAADAPTGTTVTDEKTGKVLVRFTAGGPRQFALPKPTKTKRFVDAVPGEPGEVFAYRLTRDRYVLLHLYGEMGGPVFWVPEWCGPAIPAAADIPGIIRSKPERYRLGSVVNLWRAKESDRDDRRLVRTGVVIKPPAHGLRGWFPGIVDVYPWKGFERVLKEFFGLVAVTPAVRLSHDLGLEKSAAHLALWAAAGPVTPADARRLFYGCGSGYRRSHPDRQRPAPTDGLKKAVAGLKAAFPSPRTWRGTFSPREGFVIMPVARTHFPQVWKVVARLAREHGLACYDPEAGRVVGPWG